MSAPGPANLNTAKGILAKVGLKDGDYTIDQLDMGQHINAMKAGTFDGGYTLEPNASVMNQLGFAKTVEAGVIAKYVLGDPQSDPFAAGCAFSADFIAKRPDVAKRFAAAWARALDLIKSDPQEARKHLLKNTLSGSFAWAPSAAMACAVLAAALATAALLRCRRTAAVTRDA